MKVKSGMTFQPCFNFGMVARTIVIQNHMDAQFRGYCGVDLSQEFPKFNVAMPWITGANNFFLQHVQRREQARGTIALVVMGHGSAAPFFHRC